METLYTFTLADGRLVAALLFCFMVGLATGSLATSLGLAAAPAPDTAPTEAERITRREQLKRLLGTFAVASVLVAFFALLPHVDESTLDARMERELARHQIDIREKCPAPEPDLSSTITVILNDESLDQAPTVEQCFRIRVREYMPAHARHYSERAQ